MILLTLPNPVTISVDGDGALRFVRGGALVYARRATLRAQGGLLVNEAGSPLAPRVAVAGPFTVALDGTITAGGKVAGRIVLARVANGRATLMNPGEGLAGVIRTGGPAIVQATPAPRPSTARTVSRPTESWMRPSRMAKVAAPPSDSWTRPVKPAKVASISISVRAQTSLDGERILLGKIADIQAPPVWKTRLAAVDLGGLPPLGTTRVIGASYVRTLVRALGLAPDAFAVIVPTGATTARNGVVIEAQEILDQALVGNEGFVSSRTIAPMTVPVGTLSLTATQMSRAVTGRSVVVTATVDGKLVSSRTIALVPDPNVPTAKIGETVRLRLVSGGATIEIPAKVKTGGREGSDVTVVTQTGSVHTGRLLPNGLVEVRL